MGTRALILLKEEEGSPETCVIYKHWDGYIEGLGYGLIEYLSEIRVVNGLSATKETAKVANGMSCLFAQLVAHMKKEPGDVYLYAPETRDIGEEFVYTIFEKEDSIYLACEDAFSNELIFMGECNESLLETIAADR